MTIIDRIKSASGGLLVHKSRSVLTILGIVVGVAAIVMISALGENASKVIVGELGGLGAETIIIRPGKEPTGPSDMASILFSDSLKKRELDAISNIPNIVDVAPEVLVAGKSASYQNQTYRPMVLGFTASFMVNVLDLKVSQGDIFYDSDIKDNAKVAIIGTKVKEQLFGNEDPIGKNIEISRQKFRVIGIFDPRGQVVFFNVDELVLVPYTTAQTYLMGIKYYNQIAVRASSPETVDSTVYEIKTLLRDMHKITDPTKDDFSVQTQQGLIKQVSSIINMFTVFLTFVVAISLVVGGIGIMNIMLVSVSERTKEIGLRKAIGATDNDILLQFLFEAMILTFFGGVVGLLIGFGLSVVATFLIGLFLGTSLAYSIPITASVIGLVSSVGIGIIFGSYPALQASKKSPIEALRYE
ncbi:MAG: ABC transporter permease [Candidatus Paceibacterota bacterium]